MANHKKRKPKAARSGCLMCKPWKMSGISPLAADSEKFSDHRRRLVAKQDIRENA